MLIKSLSKILYRMMSAIIVAGLFNTAEAETAERPQEINHIYEFDGKDMKGYGVGVNSDISGIGSLFGLPSDWNVQLAPQQKNEEKGWLGIAMKLPTQRTKQQSPGQIYKAVEVASIMPGSAAEAAGLREGDLIFALDGKPIEGNSDKLLVDFRMAMTRKLLEEIVKLRVLRGDAQLELEATIKPYPRAKSALKPHMYMEKKPSSPSLLQEALEKEGLKDEYLRLIKQFHNETDKVISPLVYGDAYNPFRLQEVNYLMYNPMDLPVVSRNITDRLHGAFGQTHHDLAALLQTAMDELDMPTLPATAESINPPADLSDYVERLVNAIRHANEERMAVLSVLDAEQIDLLYANAPKLLLGNFDSGHREKTEAEIKEDDSRALRFFQLVLKLDVPRLLNASVEVARALDLETLKRLNKTAGWLKHYPKSWIVREEKNLTVIDTPAGRVLIGGKKNNTYTEEAALILDFGGNDTYLNHAGGSTRLNPFSVVIDLSGDDVYTSTDYFSQGAGLLGGGFLIDLKGNDRYTAQNYAQGTGVLGVGILVDLAGRDQYKAVSVAQGAGSFGVGLLAEGGGNDSYYANYFAQGAGYVKGFGAIVEAAGDDNYYAGGLFEDFRAPGKNYLSMSQGFGYGMRPDGSFVGASGGIGVIAEAEGNDSYEADYFAQGSSYWFSLGILDDRKGNDRYVSGRYSQGAGIHQSAGVLIDGAGDDNYLARFGVAQGCGHDYGIGFLLDNGGNDSYFSGIIAQGAGNDGGIGVLSDNGGDDKYYLSDSGQGRGNFEPVRDVGSFGFLFDTGGGNDVYSQGGKNNSLIYKTRWGIHIDSN